MPDEPIRLTPEQFEALSRELHRLSRTQFSPRVIAEIHELLAWSHDRPTDTAIVAAMHKVRQETGALVSTLQTLDDWTKGWTHRFAQDFLLLGRLELDLATLANAIDAARIPKRQPLGLRLARGLAGIFARHSISFDRATGGLAVPTLEILLRVMTGKTANADNFVRNVMNSKHGNSGT